MTSNAKKNKNLQKKQQHQIISKIQAHIRGYYTRKYIVLYTQNQFQTICESVWNKISSHTRFKSVSTSDSISNCCSLYDSSLFYNECIPLWISSTQKSNHHQCDSKGYQKYNNVSIIYKPKFGNKQEFEDSHVIEINKMNNTSKKLDTILQKSHISSPSVECDIVSDNHTNFNNNTFSYHKNISFHKKVPSTNQKKTNATLDTHLSQNSNKRTSSMRLLRVGKIYLTDHNNYDDGIYQNNVEN